MHTCHCLYSVFTWATGWSSAVRLSVYMSLEPAHFRRPAAAKTTTDAASAGAALVLIGRSVLEQQLVFAQSYSSKQANAQDGKPRLRLCLLLFTYHL